MPDTSFCSCFSLAFRSQKIMATEPDQWSYISRNRLRQKTCQYALLGLPDRPVWNWNNSMDCSMTLFISLGADCSSFNIWAAYLLHKKYLQNRKYLYESFIIFLCLTSFIFRSSDISKWQFVIKSIKLLKQLALYCPGTTAKPQISPKAGAGAKHLPMSM